MEISGIPREMIDDMAKVSAALQSCKAVQLKGVCRANYLMKMGIKSDLIDRLVLAHFHGCPGRCPSCLHAKLEYVYDDNIVPKQVQCKVLCRSHT